jgi:hypothetical protein
VTQPTLEQVLTTALRSLATARESLPLTESITVREVVMREVVSAELSVSRALQLIGAGP